MRAALWVVLAACGRSADVPPAPPVATPPPPEASPRLRKAELRSTLKALVPLLQPCYETVHRRDPGLRGVINTKLTIASDPAMGVTFRVNGFETHGTLGESREFLACVTRTFESHTAPPIATAGRIEVTYPSTFSPEPPSERDTPIVDRAERAAADQRWSDAFADAERGLTLTSLDGPYRRRLIEVGGLAACRLGNEARARFYFSLASSEIEDRLIAACPAIDFLD